MFPYYFLGIFGSYLYIKCIVGYDFYDRPFLAETKAAGCYDLYFVCYSVFFECFIQIVCNGVTGRSFASRTSTNQNLQVL